MSWMADGIKSMARFSWAMSLFGVRQTAELMTALGSARSPRQAAASFDAVARAAAEQLEAWPLDTYAQGDRWQGELIDAFFRAFNPMMDSSKEVASQTLVRGSLSALRQSARILESAMPRGGKGGSASSRVAWQELCNKLEAFDSFQYADRILGSNDGFNWLAKNALLTDAKLQEELERAGRRDPYLSLWLTEGLGFAFAEAAWDDGEPRHLLRRPALRSLPAESLIPLHTGMGLSLARRLMPDLDPADSAGVAAVLERFRRLCLDNSRDGFVLAAYEALGLAVRQLAPRVAGEISVELAHEEDDGAWRGAFWHGYGRGLYFAASQALPGSLGRAVTKLRREVPEGVAYFNALAGLTWAVTLVNFRQPEILEALLEEHRFRGDEAGAAGHGVASAVVLWRESAGEEACFVAFRRHLPAADVAEDWQRLVREPCDEALAGWSEVEGGPGPGELFRYSGSPTAPLPGDALPETGVEPASSSLDLERDADGEVGRVVSWLTLGRPRTADPVTETAVEPVVDVAETEAAAADDAEPAEETAAAAGEPIGGLDPLEQQILDALAVSEDGAAIRDLQRSTGGKATTLRSRLKRLTEAGRVERRGAGMRTRYHLAAERRDDG